MSGVALLFKANHIQRFSLEFTENKKHQLRYNIKSRIRKEKILTKKSKIVGMITS
jgi:hypothetical protein